MTKKHFEEIARQIERTLRGPAQAKLAFRLADSFEHFNPYFDRERFLTACGIKGVGGMMKPAWERRQNKVEAYRAAEAVLDAEARARYIDNQRARKASK